MESVQERWTVHDVIDHVHLRISTTADVTMHARVVGESRRLAATDRRRARVAHKKTLTTRSQ